MKLWGEMEKPDGNEISQSTESGKALAPSEGRENMRWLGEGRAELELPRRVRRGLGGWEKRELVIVEL
jgi:hypothetical protein